MSVELWVAILLGSLALAAPLLIAGVGEGFVERAGRLNLGIEGMMILGAFAGVWVADSAGWLAGLAAGAIVGLVLALVMELVVTRLRANEIVVGLAITILGLGLSTYLFQVWIPAGNTNVSVARVPDQFVVCGAVLLAVAAWWIMRFTRFGLQVRAVGSDPASATLRGVRSRHVGATVLVFGGVLAGLAGAAITLGTIGSFTPGVTAGRGYVVLAVVIMGRATPVGIALGALLFAFLQSFSLNAQSLALGLPSEVYQTLPYAVTLVVLVLTSARRVRTLAARGALA